MANISIRSRSPENETPLSIRDFDIKIDGHRISGLHSMNIYLNKVSTPSAHLVVSVDDLSVDKEFMLFLEGFVKEEEDGSYELL